eukprot:TRINITY_DN3801_c0_g1_i1.p1 TRINITY_DN3801_c0_g1~~TRINITY_DN3801_c0_g1_i1.p1  ORF type:complete len:510 (+),score=104.71 TRINITY_DN3801_c0_g1_i1:96-1625(+)
MVANTSAGEKYSNPVAFIYVFNLIVGVGALNLPHGFAQSGMILGVLFLALNSFLAFITVTWLIEAQAVANAILSFKEMGVDASEKQRKIQTGDYPSLTGSESTDVKLRDSSEKESLLSHKTESQSPKDVFEITRRIEVGLMSELFLGPIGQKIFYVILVIYLYGDLAIYAVTIPSSLAKVTGGWTVGGHYLNSCSVYYIYLAIFAFGVIPMSCFNFQKTKILQYITLATRNFSLLTMIILSIYFVAKHQNHVHINEETVPLFNVSALPAIFGVSIYAFMCHHSLPSLLSPVKDKSRLNTLMGLDFVAIFMVYTGLCTSAMYAFGAGNIQELYTWNFYDFQVKPIAIILVLYPVFTLTTNFPLIAITLRNNLMLLIPYGESYPKTRQFVFALIATLPPIGVAFGTQSVDVLVSVTGSYAGLGIMLVMPSLLVFYARRKVEKLRSTLGLSKELRNPHASPFSGILWIILILIASVLCVALVTYKQISTAIEAHHHHPNSTAIFDASTPKCH